ncbi:thioredoxin domain-containing protein [Rhodocaloribacter litoris]|uniref:thioredoxin domain-containing protein n=1 Tax=Rhodocaloribacter litoris TaxID=2558931 RepID=UPI001E55EB2E|nr:thioredoxin domain-containing protein [Rhodocaloribacter litoris]QXD15100.1 thioredoxin domain-containing protein [Rhodocaloribacter litoris]
MPKQGSARRQRREKRVRRAQVPPLRTGPLWGTLGLAVFGGALALYATGLTFEIARQGVIDPSGCSLNDFINCDVAHASSYAFFLGVPVAWWGFLFYLWTALAALYATRTQNREAATGAVALTWLLSLGAVLFSAYKAWHLVNLGVLCLVCVGMYAANLGIAVLLPPAINLSYRNLGAFLVNYARGLAGQEAALDFDPKPARYGLLLAALFGLGFVGIQGYNDGTPGRSDVDVQQAVSLHFRQPPVDIPVPADAPVWGNPAAPIRIVEFADFQCPACRESAFHLRGTLYEFRDDVALYFMHYPLDRTINERLQRQVHVQAGPAARAAVCAAQFGDFWGYHDELFRNQTILGERLYLGLAEQQGWDTEAFAACLNGEAALERVRRDVTAGTAIGVSATPSIYVNGRRVALWRNSDVIRAVIREELKRLGS